jgi:hypothetical protein
MNTVWLLVIALELFFASKSATGNSVAETIIYCFSAYMALQFMTKKKDGDGK